jgi:ribosomal protein L11 methyltransferase
MKHWPALRLTVRPSAPVSALPIQDRLATALDDLHPTAVQESDGEWLVFFGTLADRDAAATALPASVGSLVTLDALDIPDDDWARRSQQDLEPVHVGRVTIAPPWHAGRQEACPTQITILIQPSMGFGTGHHASTRLCTALLQRIDLDGKTVLDAGTGSGVLALAARALGARSVVAVDDDADAIAAARENLALNGVSSGITLRVGDFRTLATAPADVVTANLTGGLLIRGADVLVRAVARGGALIIGGVMREEEAEVMAAFTPALALADRLSEDEWIGAMLTRPREVR